MKKLIFFLLLSISSFSLADPFYTEQNETPATNEQTSPSSNSQCSPTETVNEINLTADFRKLTLVGIVLFENAGKALFIDEQNNLLDFKENDYFPEQGIQIKAIHLKQLTYIDWQKTQQCDKPYQITLKL